MFYLLKIIGKDIIKTNAAFYRDPRTSHLPLLGPPWPMIVLVALYLMFVKVWGPNWLMRNRSPYNVKTLMQCYNVIQILVNFYIFWNSFRYSYMQSHFNLSCQEYNPHDMRPTHMHLLYCAYVYYISKYLDMLDTVFFVLRKKFSQITFLHVYHHTIMIYAVWAYCTLLFASHYTATGVVNSFVHVCMYTYYFMAALKLNVDLTPWKRRLTQLQIFQFCFLTIHFAQPLFNNWCGLDMFWVWLAFLQNFFILILFCDFYYKAYYIAKNK